MKSLQARYVKERENIETVETRDYFFTYQIEVDLRLSNLGEKTLAVCDLYIVPEKRRSKTYLKIIQQLYWIAKKEKCLYILGKVWAWDLNSEELLNMHQKMGMEVIAETDECTYLRGMVYDVLGRYCNGW